MDIERMPAAPGSTLEIRVPASIANLGPGFDSVAVAVGLYLTLRVHVLPGSGGLRFRFFGAEPEGGNSVERALQAFSARRSLRLPSLEVEVHSEIPMRAGLGSSAAATIAGLKLGSALAEVPCGEEEMLAIAAELEGHPDNVAAALLGDFAVSCQRDNGAVTAVRIPWPADVRFLVLTPRRGLSTSHARGVLPDQVPRSDAVANLQRLALLVWAVQTASLAHLREAMRDRLHHPYRECLVPGLADLLRFEHPDLLGACLSGAGPSLVALAHRERIGALRGALAAHLAAAGQEFTLRELSAHSNAG
jgi:homoserine kinase